MRASEFERIKCLEGKLRLDSSDKNDTYHRIYIYIYIHMYRERAREYREGERCILMIITIISPTRRGRARQRFGRGASWPPSGVPSKMLGAPRLFQTRIHVYIHTCIHILCIHVYTYMLNYIVFICIYIYRERERDIYVYATCMYMYTHYLSLSLYIYIHI